MQCIRCQGLLVEEFFAHPFFMEGGHGFDGWRCLNCGGIFDEVIAANRLLPLGAGDSHTTVTSV